MTSTIKTAGQIRKVAPIPRQPELPSNLTLLQRALYYAAAPILHEPDVIVYKEQARKRLARRYWWKRPAIRIATFLALATVGAVTTWTLIGTWAFTGIVIGIAFGFSVIGAVLLVIAEIISSFVNPLAQWGSCTFSGYSKCRDVPKVVRERAKTILRHCPDAVVTVEYLYEDPFLRVEHEGEKYYVAVWDETGFIG